MNTFAISASSGLCEVYRPESEEAKYMKNQIIADARAQGITVSELLKRRQRLGQTQVSINEARAAKQAAANRSFNSNDAASSVFDDGASTAETLVPGMDNAAPSTTTGAQTLAPPEVKERKSLRRKISEKVKEYREDKDPNKTWGDRIANGITAATGPTI